MKKSRIRLVLLLLVTLLIFTACGNDNDTQRTGAGSHLNVKVVTSFYPIYFLANEIGGDVVEISNLVSSGVEPHNWSPKSKDLMVASEADLLLYHGVGFETWIDSFQKGLDKKSEVKVTSVSKGISLIDTSRETNEDEHGHQEDEHAHDDHAHEEDANEEDGHNHSHTIDPHTWVSPKSALKLAENIKQALIDISPEHQTVFEQNFNELSAKIKQIDAEYERQLSSLAKKHIVVSHQSFGYVARDYGLEQISIMGLNPNSEPRAQDIMYIADLVKQYDVNYIFFEALINDNLAKMLAAEAKVDTMMLYSLEGLTTTQEKQGENYLSLMELNLQNLISALQ